MNSRRALVARDRKALSELLGKLVRFRSESASPTAKTFAATFSEGDDCDVYVLFVAVSTRPTLVCEGGRLEHLVPTALTSEQREALLARGFALTPSGHAGRREVVIENPESAEREACAVLEVLFDVFDYRGGQALQTSLPL